MPVDIVGEALQARGPRRVELGSGGTEGRERGLSPGWGEIGGFPGGEVAILFGPGSAPGALEQGSGRKHAVQLTHPQARHGHSLREQVCGEEAGILIWTQLE